MSQSEQVTLTTPTLSITNFDLPSLHLLHDEIIVTLKDTETHLSEFNDDKEQAPLLLDSIGVLTQLSRIFELISLGGGQVLSSAIVHGLQQLYNSGDNNNTALIMDLSEAIMTLDRYIEFVLLTETVEPTLLLPIINKLNRYGSQTNIAEDYFADFGTGSVIIANPEQNFQPLSELNLDTKLMTNAFRSGFSVALTHKNGAISAEDKQKLVAMSAACELIAAHSSRLFWQAASAAVTDIEAILPLSLSQKHTLVYLEQQFHNYLPIMDAKFAELVSLACQRDGQQAHSIRAQYAVNRLDGPQREQLKRFLFGPNRQVTDTLNDLIQAQIYTIKEKVDSYARGGSLNPLALQTSQIADELVELSSTLRLLGLSTAATALHTAGEAVAKWQTPTPNDFDHLLLALMSAENATIAMAKMHTPGIVKLPLNNKDISLHQLDTAYDTLIQESRTTIASAEQALNDYLADANRDVLNIQNIPEMMRQVSGAVRFLQMTISASMLSQLANYLEQRLTVDYPIDEQILAHMADIMMSVDYRLNGFEHNRPVSKRTLDLAQQSLSQLLAA
ncbi:hypothetical protein ES754_01255 [Psychrobacter frigidicola]|uniref:Chemotaxis protein n=1 Tax=Psychrobacter frigidicola TaxID=45611 RepID=A0A5C7A4P4_9GAMM|nr:hypothetical protein [Psychrobacter frigidicola]TXD97645.1 hypothetical protein ES754_01255 [Psychrobacter frigidicola]